jgi:phosphohistidine phosphatase
LIQIAGLLSGDPVEQVGSLLYLETEPVMLVGHNPYMERMAGYLLTGSADNTPVLFKTSGTACLEYADGIWSLCWALNPEIMPGD